MSEIANAIEWLGWAIVGGATLLAIALPSSNSAAISSVAAAVDRLAEAIRDQPRG